MRLYGSLVRAIILVVALPCMAEAKQLCGREVVPFAEMVAGIKADPGAEVTRETASLVEIQDAKQRMLWTLAKPSGGGPAAYICRRVVQEDGQVKILMTAECVGDALGCDGIIGRILTEQNRATAPFRQR
jgi:hypothetical protein